MLLVIFGAGASYDSTPYDRPSGHFNATDERPPLGHELFSPRHRFREAIKRFHPVEEIVPYLQGFKSDGSIERMLQDLQAEADAYPRRHMHLAALKWYLHFIFYGLQQKWLEQAQTVTNYRTILDQIDQCRHPGETVLFVTFNYDTLLEDALKARGVPLQDLPQYIRHDRFRLVKLHGSADWAREVDSEVPDFETKNTWAVAKYLIDHSDSVKISNRYRIVGHWPIGKGEAGDLTPEYPAIAIPLETKQDFECPEDHVTWLKNAAPAANRILTVGWRARDLPLLHLLRDSQKEEARVMVVTASTDGADDVVKRMRDVGIRGDYSTVAEGFSEFVSKRRGIEFLRS